VTFDDGYRDNCDRAFPLLRRFGVPATIFVTTGWLRPHDDGPGLGMSWREVREMAAVGIRFGAHTVTHPSLPALSLREAEWEIRESKRLLEEELGTECTVFAYPFGHEDCQLRQLVEAAGFRWAVTTREGAPRPSDNPLLLRRTYVCAADLLYADFAVKLAGWHEWRGPLWRLSRHPRAVYW